MKIFSWVLPALLLFCVSLPAGAQQTTDQKGADSGPQPPSAQTGTSPAPPATNSAPATDKTADKSKDTPSKTGQDQSGTSKDRLFYALPNFLTLENSGKVPPLTAKEKYKVVAKGTFDYVQIPWWAFLAGISQATDSEKGFGQGAAGYGKRFASYVGDGTIENFMTGAILPSLLHEDPRYFQSGKGSFMHRTGYSVSRIFVTRTDAGNSRFNTSEVFGSALASGISTFSYHPREDRTLTNALSVWGSQVGYDTITLVVKEFWPDIRRKLSKNKKGR